MYWNQLGLTDGVTLLWGDLSYVNDFGGITMVFLRFLITGFLGCCYCCSIWFKKIKKHEKAEIW